MDDSETTEQMVGFLLFACFRLSCEMTNSMRLVFVGRVQYHAEG